MKKFIGKVEAFNLFMAGEDGIIALDNKTEEILSFCDICMAEYRDCDELQYMIEDVAEEEAYKMEFISFEPTIGQGSAKIIPVQRDYAEAQCP